MHEILCYSVILYCPCEMNKYFDFIARMKQQYAMLTWCYSQK